MRKEVEFYGGPLNGEIRSILDGMEVFIYVKEYMSPRSFRTTTEEHKYHLAETFDGQYVMVYSGAE